MSDLDGENMILSMGLGFKISTFMIAVFVLTYNYASSTLKIEQGRLFRLFTWNILITSVFDIGIELLDPNLSMSDVGIWLVLEYGYFLFHNMLAPLYAIYVCSFTGMTLGKKAQFYWLFSLPFIFSEVMVMANIRHHEIFYLTDQMVYARGPWMIGLYIIGICYMVFGFMTFIMYRETLLKNHIKDVFILSMMVFIGMILQGLFFKVKVELITEALACLGFLLTLESEKGRFSDKFGFMSQKAFIVDIQRLLAVRQKFDIIDIELLNLYHYERLLDFENVQSLRMTLGKSLEKIIGECRVYQFDDQHVEVMVLKTENIEDFITQIRTRMKKGWKVGNVNVHLEAVVSVIHVPEDVTGRDEIFNFVSAQKAPDAHGITILNEEALEYAKREALVAKAVRKALDSGSLKVFYQPIVDPLKHTVPSAEALVRLIDDELGFIPPDEFIKISEKNGIIIEIGDFVFERVCRDIKESELKKLGVNYVEVNLSGIQSYADDLVIRFNEIMKHYGITSDQINLEITETAQAATMEIQENMMKKLHEAGFTFSLDDFGTGYSNIVRLVSNIFQNIKFDKSMLWDESAQDILLSLTKIVREMGLNVVQEGVETKEQLDLVIEAGANLIQGYYFSKPIPIEEFTEFVKDFSEEKKE